MKRIFHIGDALGPSVPRHRTVRLVFGEIELPPGWTIQPPFTETVVERQIRQRLSAAVVGNERNPIRFLLAGPVGADPRLDTPAGSPCPRVPEPQMRDDVQICGVGAAIEGLDAMQISSGPALAYSMKMSK